MSNMICVCLLILPVIIQSFSPSRPFSLISQAAKVRNSITRQFLSTADFKNGMTLEIGASMLVDITNDMKTVIL